MKKYIGEKMTEQEALTVIKDGSDINEKAYVKAWQTLVNSDGAWRNGVWVGRTAQKLINEGIILSKEDYQKKQDLNDPLSYIT